MESMKTVAFDGDEMNMHVPQCIQTAMELKYRTAVPNHFISPSTNKPIIKPSQDNLLGVFRLTADGILLTQSEALHLLAGTEAFKGVLPEPAVRQDKYIRWTGKQIYSIILPPISMVNKADNDKLEKIVIEEGIHKKGRIDKGSSGKIIQAIHSDFGKTETERYMNDLQYIISRYLVKTGFSVGPSDLVLHPDIRKKNHEMIQKALNSEVDLAKKVHLNIIEDITGNLAEIYEANVNKIAKSLGDSITDSTMKTLDLQNRIYNMVVSGAKGSETNIKQMMSLLGQQTIDGARVPIGFTDRTLPHYPRYENGMESRGFIAHSFLEGLNPKEFFFHAMSGREGLIDTAVKTANSGYLQRKLVKAMEDLKTYYDGSIRDNGGEIIEFVYGCDGFDSSKIEPQGTEFMLITGEKLYDNYLFRETEDFSVYMLKKTIDTMKNKYPDWFKQLNEYNKNVQLALDILHTHMIKFVATIEDVKLYHPVNLKKIISRATSVFQLTKITAKSTLNPIDVYIKIDELLESCTVGGQRNHVFEILVYDNLSPKRVIRDYKMTAEALEYVCTNARLGFRKGLVEAGDMVGPVAAQSIGSQTTQMTLNTFHLAGVGEKGKVTQGVPRLQEVLKVTKKPKNPSNIIYLRDEDRFERERVEKVKNSIEQTKIGEIIKGDPTFYLEPTNKLDGALDDDKTFMKFYEMFTELDGAINETTKNPWVIRMEFDRKEMIYRNVSMADIHQILKMLIPESTVMYSDDNAGKLIFRIRMPFETRENVEDDFRLLRLKANELKNIIIKGVDDIQKVYLNPPSKDCLLRGEKCKGLSKVGQYYEVKEEFSLTTDGANLFDLLMRDDVDATRSYSIDPNEMNSIFGIEAGKFIVEHQFKEILTSSGAPTSPRHIGLLVNKMAHSGEFMSVDRFGINREDIGPLAKCSFERTPDLLRDAALFGEVDRLKGVSANIMVGQIPECGTGSIKVYLDEEFLMEELHKRGIKPDNMQSSTLDVGNVFKEFQQNICVSEDDQIRMNIQSFEEDNLNMSHIPDVFVD